MSEHPEQRLPCRDYVLLPLIALCTVVLLLGCGEVAARALLAQDDAHDACEVKTSAGYRYKPHCVSRNKVLDGPWVTNRYNGCGYHTAESCAARPPGSMRVAVIGSSTTRGALVHYDDNFAARSSAMLSRLCDDKVDFQNLGSEPPDVDRIDARIPEILALKPNALVITVGPFDLVHLLDPPPPGQDWEKPLQFDIHSIIRRLRDDSRLFLVMQYYLYGDPEFQVRSFLTNGDSADYVRRPLSAEWQKRVQDFGALLARIEAKARPARLPVLLFYVPERAQAAIAAFHMKIPGVDPYAMGVALARTAAAHGVLFADTMPAFAAAPDFQALYYRTDGHPAAGGHAAMAEVVERELLSLPAFARCRHPGRARVGKNFQ